MSRQDNLKRGRTSGRRGGCGCLGCFGGCIGTMLMFIALTALACGGVTYYISQNEPKPPIENFQPSQSLANNFDNKIDSAQTGGVFNFQITEQEASSWLNLNAPALREDELPIKNMQARFRDGEASIYGEWDFMGFTTIGSEVGVTITAVNGDLVVEVTTGEIGGIGMPQSVKDQASDEIKRVIDEQLRSINGAYTINDIRIDDGMFYIAGSPG